MNIDDVLVAILCHTDVARVQRCVDSAAACPNLALVVNTDDREFRDGIANLELPPHCQVSHANRPGCPGGRNAVLEWFLRRTNLPYLSQIDGDDVLYPTYPDAVADALRRAPALDATMLVPCDQLAEWGQGEEVVPGVKAWLWGVSRCWPDMNPGPSVDAQLGGTGLTTCPAMIRLVSRKLAARHRYDEGILNGEDHYMLLKYLRDHQRGDAQVWLSMSSDWYLIDRMEPNSSQKKYPQENFMDIFRQRIAELGMEHTSVGELPVMYPPMMQTYNEKLAFAKRMAEMLL